jgi:hypothetical protein
MPKASVKQQPDDAKLRELVLLVSTLCEGDEPFGKVKLNKLLWFADFTAYLIFGQSITGHEYQRLPAGPAPRRLLAVIPALAAKARRRDPDVAVRVNDYHGREQYRPFALRPPDLSRFSAEEIKLVEEIVEEYKGKNARQMSELSHRFLGWQIMADGETIPYSTALVGWRKPTDEERRVGIELEAQARACMGQEMQQVA